VGFQHQAHQNLSSLAETTSYEPLSLTPGYSKETWTMYCFPYPQGPASATPLRVPCLATLTYSLFGTYTFETFPGVILQNKFPDNLTGKFRSDPTGYLMLTFLALKESPTSLIQTWLFFGLASEALGRDVANNEFFDNQAVGSPRGSIDLRIPIWFWSELTARWTDLAKSLSTEEYQRARQVLKDNCDLAMTVLCCWDTPFWGAGDEGDTELTLVLLSVHMLLYLIRRVFGTQKVLRTSVRARSTQLLIRAAVSRGWCRKRLNFVESVRTFYPALYFLCSSPLPHGNRGDHSSCTPTKCQVVTKLAKPNHRKHCRHCRIVQVPLNPVLRIIAEDGIPLIRIARLPSGKIQLQVVPHTRTLRFVAVSHVWADRQLGSTKNGLPNCQVEYLNSVLTKLPNLGVSISEILPLGRRGSAQHYEYFWLDTFCIPQAPEHADLRNKAIGSMNLIYATAAQTIVFDSALQKFEAGRRPASMIHGGKPSFSAPADENLLDVTTRVCASNWMGRAW